MIDILTAARAALPHTMSSATSDSGKLFVTGYSREAMSPWPLSGRAQAAGATVTGMAGLSVPMRWKPSATASSSRR